MIHVCYGLFDGDGKYSKWTGTSILSMFENSSAPPQSVTVHILHDTTLTKKNYENFIYIAGQYRQKIEFHNIENIYPDKFNFLSENLRKVFTSRFSAGTFYRLMMEKKLFKTENVSKIIYLDSDTVVNLDIAELWKYSMDNYTIAAVPEIQATNGYMIKNKYLLNTEKVKADDYFCAGVLIINLDRIDENFFYESVKWLAENPKCECFDQDILNYFFSKEYLKLPEKFNSFTDESKFNDTNMVSRKIYHYAGEAALGFDMQNANNKLFFSYFIKTPWFNENTLVNMFETAKKFYGEAKELAIVYSSISSGKKRVFFMSANFIETIKQIFDINETEKIIVEEESNSISDLIKLLKTSRTKNIFFIISDNFADIRDKLENAGFAEGQDFLDGTLFLSDKHGISIDKWSFLKNM